MPSPKSSPRPLVSSPPSPTFDWEAFLLDASGQTDCSSYCQFLESEPLASIAIVREGVPTRMLAVLAKDMQISRPQLLAWMDIPETAVKRKNCLGACESEKILDLARLIGQIQKMVHESGEPQGFDAAMWLAHWLKGANPVLGGRAPGEYLDTAQGRAIVSQAIARMQSGAYS